MGDILFGKGFLKWWNVWLLTIQIFVSKMDDSTCWGPMIYKKSAKCSTRLRVARHISVQPFCLTSRLIFWFFAAFNNGCRLNIWHTSTLLKIRELSIVHFFYTSLLETYLFGNGIIWNAKALVSSILSNSTWQTRPFQMAVVIGGYFLEKSGLSDRTLIS